MLEEFGIGINLLKTIIGGGILYFPMLFQIYGWILASIITTFSAILSIFGLQLLSLCNSHSKDDAPSISSLAKEYTPHLRLMADFFIFFKCFGVATAYLIIAKQTLQRITFMFCDTYCPRGWIMLLGFIIFVSPFAFFRKITHLKYTSLVGVLSIMAVILISGYRFYTSELHPVPSFSNPSWSWLQGIGSFIFAFTCHQNLMALQNEMKNPSEFQMRRIIITCILISLISYLTFGYVNCALYNGHIHDNILENMPTDRLSIFIFALYVIVMGFSYPLQLNPCRLSLYSMLNITKKQSTTRSIHIMATLLLLFSTYSLAVSKIDLGTVYAFIGSTSSAMICLFLPSILFFYMDFSRNWGYRLAAIILLLCGFLVMLSMVVYFIG